MIRFVVLGIVGALAIAGCQTMPTGPMAPYPPRAIAPPRPQTPPNVFIQAPRAIVMSQLFVCRPSLTNVGPISADGEATDYTPYMHTEAGDLLRNPTQGACLSSGFGLRTGAMGSDVGSAHTGIDLANPAGGFVFAAGAGRVISLGWRGAYGLVIELDHGAGVRTLYAHLAETDPRLAVGSWAPAGVAIARMGQTGNATGVHLHYEVAIGDMRVDPLAYETAATFITRSAAVQKTAGGSRNSSRSHRPKRGGFDRPNDRLHAIAVERGDRHIATR